MRVIIDMYQMMQVSVCLPECGSKFLPICAIYYYTGLPLLGLTALSKHIQGGLNFLR
jgi:putative component of membrane protein insertase Oxa1/YidC/SpoIIIJ protein YidD